MKDHTVIATIVGGLIATAVVKTLQFKSNQKRIDAQNEAKLEAARIAREAMEQEHEQRMKDIREKGEEELRKQREQDEKDFEEFKKRCEEICHFHGFDFTFKEL